MESDEDEYRRRKRARSDDEEENEDEPEQAQEDEEDMFGDERPAAAAGQGSTRKKVLTGEELREAAHKMRSKRRRLAAGASLAPSPRPGKALSPPSPSSAGCLSVGTSEIENNLGCISLFQRLSARAFSQAPTTM